MGREIRRVPPNWEHPRYSADNATRRSEIGEFISMHDDTYEHASKEWIANFALWQAGEHPSQLKDPDASWIKGQDFWEYDSPPSRELYRPAFTEEPTWWQVYQTVSEGTPVTPPFATPEELIDHLATVGDAWDQSRGDGPWDRQAAESFVKQGWAPSMVVKLSPGKMEILSAKDAGIYETSNT